MNDEDDYVFYTDAEHIEKFDISKISNFNPELIKIL